MTTLYQYELSPFCDKIRRVLNVKRIPYEIRNISILETVMGLKKITPTGKLPALEYNGTITTDSTTIAHAFEVSHPDPPLIPTEPKMRALCHFLEDWADESLYFFVLRMRWTFPHNARRWLPKLVAQDGKVMQTLAGPFVPTAMRGVLDKQGLGRKSDAAVIEDLQRNVRSLADYLGDGRYLVGHALTLADISVFAQMDCLRGTEEGAGLLNTYATVQAWMDTIDAQTARRA